MAAPQFAVSCRISFAPEKAELNEFCAKKVYCNKDVDRMLETAIKTRDAKPRYELYRKVIQVSHDDDDIPLAYVPRYFVFQQKVLGFDFLRPRKAAGYTGKISSGIRL